MQTGKASLYRTMNATKACSIAAAARPFAMALTPKVLLLAPLLLRLVDAAVAVVEVRVTGMPPAMPEPEAVDERGRLPAEFRATADASDGTAADELAPGDEELYTAFGIPYAEFEIWRMLFEDEAPL